MLNTLSAFFDLTPDQLVPYKASGDLSRHIESFLDALQSGQLRAATRREDGQWIVNPQVKKGILLAFRGSDVVAMGDAGLPFTDRACFGVQAFDLERRVRVVPGGSSVRRGAFLGAGVTLMPPAYVNVGAFVDEGTMIDSHALVGSCAQVGKRVHLSAASQLGGVLEPIGALPVVVEDDVFVGGNCGIYEGTVIRRGAVIGAGEILTRSLSVYDLPNERIISAEGDGILEIPENAVVIPGSRPARGPFAKAEGLSVYTPIIVKYRDSATDKKAMLELALRQ